MKRFPSPVIAGLFLIVLSALLFMFEGCKRSRSDIGALVAKESGNKVFKEIDAEVFAEKLKAAITADKSLRNPDFTAALYAAKDYEPVLTMKFLADSSIKKAALRIAGVSAHGLPMEMFRLEKLNGFISKIYDKESVKNVDEAYAALVGLEIAAASSLTDYANAMQFGVISPRRIYAQYYTSTKRPDSVSFTKVFETKDLDAFLDSIQPKDKAYLLMQAALADKQTAPGLSAEETARILKVNLERMRWKNRPTQDKYVFVNIPDFSLQVINQNRVELAMKVCVGEGRNDNAAVALTEYDENDLKKDRPFNRETPQLSSEIHSVQVNPVWNIPESIATNEISVQAAKDRYYLANNNIDVFYNGKKVDDPETIDWSAAGVGKTYTFKQRPGDDNSLGKIKFLFDNQSSVYLHDTPAKAAFSLPVRAVSHGCVRVEKPLELAQALFGTGSKFEKIKTEMASKTPKAENLSLDKKVPVYLSYQTCWMDAGTGKLRFARDIYGLDAVLFTYLGRL
ncbi:L,D-transpeptidase family protein [Pedobacter sp. BMA]|uniref:L,D-transpeptidase family protein n=1 Tax=Pedobacter sp. BMA TaxID=1663685 RepID=UPI000A7F8C30|nr:L,D-transpeptidase family protein [Pedobacter sp. BMA]